MKSLMLFLHEVLYDLGDWCSVSTSLDFKTIQARVEMEGIEFLTITLPQYGRDFEKSLSLGGIHQPSFKSFKKLGETPILFGGFMDGIFDRYTGTLLESPDKAMIQAIRQITLMFAKIELPSSEEREAAAFAKYVEVDQEISLGVRDNDWRIWDELYSPSWDPSGSLTNRLFGRTFSSVSQKLYDGLILPKHGPGATAERLRANAKYLQNEWPVRLNEIFEFGLYLYPNRVSPEATDVEINFLEPGDERPVRVISVPKTNATPRIIAIEPTCMQYVQQGLLEAFVTAVSEDKLLRKFISFEDQTPNQRMALKGSLDGSLATLDLSEASDRMALWHVETLFAGFSSLLEAILACRSTTADVPGHGVIPLRKFASMGSALTFPLETMFFLNIVFQAIERERGVPLTRKDIMSFAGKVRIYGDDIIVPTEYAESVVRRLEIFGLKVNVNKSFWTGSFRESCGKEYYDGTDVTLTRMRQMLPTQRSHVKEIISTESLRNQLFKRGFTRSVDYLDSIMMELIPFPVIGENSPVLGRLSYGPVKVEKMHGTLHKPLVWGCAPTAKLPVSKLDGWGALMKFFLKRGDLPIFSKEHLSRAGRPVAITLKTGWYSPE